MSAIPQNLEENPLAGTDSVDDIPEEETGYKAPEPKSVKELQELDKDDESLAKWKKSLLEGAGVDEGKKGEVQVLSLALETEGRPDVVLDLTNKDLVESLQSKPVVIKEGIDYRLKVKFRVLNDVVTGFKYYQVVKRKGITMDKQHEMIGSYAPAKSSDAEPMEKKFPVDTAPSGMLARGAYGVKSKFLDDYGRVYMEFKWILEVKKDWE